MKNFINNISSDKLAFRGFTISFALMLLTFIYTAINYPSLPPFVPIFNQLPWGANRITPTPGIFIPTVVFAFIFVFNVIFTSLTYSKNPLMARIVAAVTIIIALMNFLFVIRAITNIV